MVKLRYGQVLYVGAANSFLAALTHRMREAPLQFFDVC